MRGESLPGGRSTQPGIVIPPTGRVYPLLVDEPEAENENVVLFRPSATAPDGYEVISSEDTGAEEREELRREAAIRKALYVFRVQGAKLRAELLPRTMLQSLADGTTGLMMSMIMQGELKPATAKEAAEVAKIAHAIARVESGIAKTDSTDRAAPGDRAEMESDIGKMKKELADRARRAAQAEPELLGGVFPEGHDVPEVDLSDFDFGEDGDAES